jgi:hypothetical protein
LFGSTILFLRLGIDVIAKELHTLRAQIDLLRDKALQEDTRSNPTLASIDKEG